MGQAACKSLIGPADPAPIEVLHDESPSDLVLVCEHAGRAIPEALGILGISEDVLNSHRGWDIGAEEVARRLSDALCAPLVIQRYSRLVIDCNRPPDSPDSVPPMSDHQDIPGNRIASRAELAMRVNEIFWPFDHAVTEVFRRWKRRAAFSIHSFSPHMGGEQRPWHAGFLTRASTDTAELLMRSVDGRQPGLTLALNEPYQIDDQTDWFVPRYAEALGLPHCLIEIRNDQIIHSDGARLWAGILAGAIGEFMEANACL